MKQEFTFIKRGNMLQRGVDQSQFAAVESRDVVLISLAEPPDLRDPIIKLDPSLFLGSLHIFLEFNLKCFLGVDCELGNVDGKRAGEQSVFHRKSELFPGVVQTSIRFE